MQELSKGNHRCHILRFTWHTLMHLGGATSGISGLSSHLTASVGAMALNLVKISAAK